MNRETDSGHRTTTAKSLTILEALMELDGARPTELAEYTGINKSTVHSHLQTLAEYDFVVQEGDIYYVGPKLVSMGEYVKGRKRIYDTIRDGMSELVEDTGEQVNFSIEANGRVVAIDDEYSSNYRKGSLTGTYFPMHCTATGKAILAEYSDSQIDRVVEQYGLEKFTEYTITDRQRLNDEIETIREQGYAVSNQEYQIGQRAVGACVHNALEMVCGGLALTVPSYRYTEDEDEEIADQLLATIERLERGIVGNNLV